MTLEQLRIFVAVAEREHVTRAAVDLNLTQSATSAAVAVLETYYAIKLFNRIGRRIELTQAGRLFLVEARAVLARAAAAENVLTDIAGVKRGSLRLAASQTVGNYWLPPLMHRYRAAYPDVALALAASIEAGSLIDLNFALPKRQFFALHHKERSITQAERELFKFVDRQSTRRRISPSTRTKRR